MNELVADNSIRVPSKEELINLIKGLDGQSRDMVRKAVSTHLQTHFKLRSQVDLKRVNVKRKTLFERCYDLADLRLLVKIDSSVPDNDVLHLLAREFDSVSCFRSFAHYAQSCGTPDFFVSYVGSNSRDFLKWLNNNIDSTLLMAALHAGMLNGFLPLYLQRKHGGNKGGSPKAKYDSIGLFLSIYTALNSSGNMRDFKRIKGLDRFVALCLSDDFSWLKQHPFLRSFGKLGCLKQLPSAIQELESIRAAMTEFDFSSLDSFDYVKAYLKKNPDYKSAFCSHFGLDGAAHYNMLSQLYPNEVLLRYARLGELNTLPLDVDRDNRYVYEEAAKGAFHLINTSGCLFYVIDHLEADPSAFLRYFGFPGGQSFESIKQQVLANRQDSDFAEVVHDGLIHKSLPYMLNDFGHMKAIRKNERLSKQLDVMRETMCGIGTRRLKLLLNKLVKGGDQLAQAYRMALELEDVNIQAKRSYGKYQDKIYEKKHKLLIELMDLCREQDYAFGYQSCNGRGVNVIIYFELPHVDQISFHSHMPSIPTNIPPYTKEWNGLENHTLPALESALVTAYPEEIAKVKASMEKQAHKAS